MLVWMMVAIWPHYRWVAVAQGPYFVWVSLAPVLQLSITWMNRAKEPRLLPLKKSRGQQMRMISAAILLAISSQVATEEALQPVIDFSGPKATKSGRR